MNVAKIPTNGMDRFASFLTVGGELTLPNPVTGREALTLTLFPCNRDGTRTLAVDRIKGFDAPPEAGEWLKEHVWPFVARREGAALPTGATYAQLTLDPEDLPAAAAVWVPQELAWQASAAIRGGCIHNGADRCRHREVIA